MFKQETGDTDGGLTTSSVSVWTDGDRQKERQNKLFRALLTAQIERTGICAANWMPV